MVLRVPAPTSNHPPEGCELSFRKQHLAQWDTRWHAAGPSVWIDALVWMIEWIRGLTRVGKVHVDFEEEERDCMQVVIRYVIAIVDESNAVCIERQVHNKPHAL